MKSRDWHIGYFDALHSVAVKADIQLGHGASLDGVRLVRGITRSLEHETYRSLNPHFPFTDAASDERDKKP